MEIESAIALIYCRRNRAKMTQGACDKRRKRDTRHTDAFYECKGCEGGEPLGEEKILMNTSDAVTKPGLCTECGERPWNPKYFKIKKCSKCVAKTRKKRAAKTAPAPAAKPGPGVREVEEIMTTREPPKNVTPVTLTTINSDRLEDDTLECIAKAHEWCELLKKDGIPCQLEIRIRIVPEEGRVQ